MSKNSKCIDPSEVRAYLNDPWNHKYSLGLYFSAIHEISGPIYIDIKIKVDGVSSWYNTLHSLHDGFDALKVLSDKIGANISFPKYNCPKSKNKLKSLLLALNSKPKNNQMIKRVSTDSSHYKYRQETLKIVDDSTVNLSTAAIIKVVSKVSMKYFSGASTSRWMIPVRISNESGLQASYIGLNINNEDSHLSIGNELKKKLKQGEHWGHYFIAKAGLLFGNWAIRNGTRKALSNKEGQWLGSVSNLGNITSPDNIGELVMLAPVRYHRPIGAAIYKLNKTFYLTYSLHESLDTELLVKVIDEIRTEIYST